MSVHLVECGACKRPSAALVTTTIVLERVDQRTGAVKRETRTTRLCCSCCGDESPPEPRPAAPTMPPR